MLAASHGIQLPRPKSRRRTHIIAHRRVLRRGTLTLIQPYYQPINMAAESLRRGLFSETRLKNHRSFDFPKLGAPANFCSRAYGASQESLYNRRKLYKELGMFSLKKRIGNSVLRAEMLTPTTGLELEAAQHCNQENIRDSDLWEDIGKSNEILVKLTESAKVVDALRDLKFKAEEAKLITELAGMDAINYELLKQAYGTSLDVNKFLDKYEMSNLLKEPYDLEGACVTIESRSGDTYSERWAGQLTEMYMKWAERQGYAGRIVEKHPSDNGCYKSITIELEFKFAYGFLSGERGVHSMMTSTECTACNSDSAHPKSTLKVGMASVDVVPIFIESSPNLQIADEEILVSYPSDGLSKVSSAVNIQHKTTGLHVQSASERSRFANKIKALNRLKAKLVVVMEDRGISCIRSIKKDDVVDLWIGETRKYMYGPSKMVHDLKSGFRVHEVNAILNGNLDPLIAAHITSRQTKLVL